jgi:PadR family transcriptional regulator PadR
MTVDVGAQLRKGVVEYCILGLLDGEPMYGWQLSEPLVSAGMIASIGTLYPILGRLRSQGLALAFDGSSASGPVRKYYRLTPLGRAQLAAFRLQWGPFAASVNQLIGEDAHD